jgi:hypothetical protein
MTVDALAAELARRLAVAHAVRLRVQRHEPFSARALGEVFPDAGFQVDREGITGLALQRADDPLVPAALALREPLGDKGIRARE